MKHVLMVPLRRCGSNAIRLRMNLHPDFYSPYPLHLCDMMELDKQYNKQDDLDYFQMIVDLVGLQHHSLIPWEDIVFDPITIFEKIKEKPRSIYQVYWEMLSQIGKKQNAHVIMDKSQDSVCDFEELVELLPDLIFLDVVRDPRAQISSMNNSIIYDFETQLNTLRWVEARKWCDLLREKYPHKIMTIRYEDFILQHEETMRRICHFFDIPFDPIVLKVQQSKEAYIMSNLSPLWETNYSQPIMEPIQKYKNYLNMKEIEHIENMTLEWMKKYNYIPMTQHLNVLCYNLDTANQYSYEKKQKIWEMLKKNYPFDYILRKTRFHYIKNCKKKNL